LSKVIPRKDIPQIYTMYNAGVDAADRQGDLAHKLPLEAFRKKREEVVAEVLRTKSRHWDNIITSTEETLRQLSMVATVVSAVRRTVSQRMLEVKTSGYLMLGLPGVVAAWMLHGSKKWDVRPSGAAAFWGGYGAVCWGVVRLLWEHCRQFERLQLVNLDGFFEEAYAWFFIHADSEDLRSRWTTVRARTASILRAVASVTDLPPVAAWEIDRINESLTEDVDYLRRLALLGKEKVS